MYITILIPQLLIMLFCYAVVMILVFPSFGFISIIFLGPAGLTWTWFTILQLSVQASTILTTLILMPEIEKLVFDSVLSKEFNDDLVLLGKLRRIKHVPFLVKVTNIIFSVPTWLVVPYLILRALVIILFGLIPVVGPVIAAYIKAPTRGLQAHARYFTLKGYDTVEIKKIYKARKAEYIGFGLVANVLESVPFFNLLFLFTNTIGAALWVAKDENESKLQALRHALNSGQIPTEPIPALLTALGDSAGKSSALENGTADRTASEIRVEVDIDDVEDIDHPDGHETAENEA